MEKLKISYDTYDVFLEVCDRIESPTYWPDIDDIDIMRDNPEKWIAFACYLWEKGQKPQSKEEQYKKKICSCLFRTLWNCVIMEIQFMKGAFAVEVLVYCRKTISDARCSKMLSESCDGNKKQGRRN